MNLDDVKNNYWGQWLKPLLPMIIPPLLFHAVKKKQKHMSLKERIKEHSISFIVGTCSTIALSNIIFYVFKVNSDIFRTCVNCFLYATAEPLWTFIINLKIGTYVYSVIKVFFESLGDFIKNWFNKFNG
jgi:hypothetical protein